MDSKHYVDEKKAEKDQDWNNCFLDTTLNDEDCEKKSIISNVNSIISRMIEERNILI